MADRLNSRYTTYHVDLVEHYRDLFLPGWRIALREEVPDEFKDDPPAAIIGWDDDLFTANLWFDDNTLNGPDGELRATIVHELMHPMFRGMRAEFMPSEEDDPEGHERWSHFEEQIVERVGLAVGNPLWADTIRST